MNTSKTMERTWTTKGYGYNETPEQKEQLAAMFDCLVWLEVSDELTMDMGYAEPINTAINELCIPTVSHVAISNEMAPYGLFGIRGHFSNGWANIYICLEVNNMVVLATDFYPVDSNDELN